MTILFLIILVINFIEMFLFLYQVNTSNIGNIVRELFQENIVRGRYDYMPVYSHNATFTFFAILFLNCKKNSAVP